MSTATPADVKDVIATDLSTSDIQSYLDDATFENEQANNVGALTTAHITQIEKRLAALKIRQVRDRSVKSGGQGSSQVTYEGHSVNDLRRMVDAVDPSGELSGWRDTSRNVSSTATDS